MTILAKMQKRYKEKFDPVSVSVPVSEVGRHCKPKVPREERLCKVCVQNEIEDEIHLLFHCTKYEYIGKQFIAKQSQILNLTSFDDYVISSSQYLTKLQFIVLLSILANASC